MNKKKKTAFLAELRRKANSRSGFAANVWACIGLICFMMFLSFLITYAISINTVRDAKRELRSSADAALVKNAIEYYKSIKQGSDEADELFTNGFFAELANAGTYDEEAGIFYCRNAEGEELYRIKDFNVDFIDEEETVLRIKCDCTMILVMNITSEHTLTPVIPLHIESDLNDKF